MYAPYEFVMNPNMTNNKFTTEHKNELYQNFIKLNKKFVQKGNYVIIGEMGIINKNNTQQRIDWGQYYLENCRNFQLSAFLWDNGKWDNTLSADDTWGFFRRSQLTWENGVFIDAVLHSAKSEFKENYETFTFEPIATFNTENVVIDYGNKKFDVTLSSKDIIDQVGFGWNLGNTFDAFNDEYLPNQGLSSETCWGNPETTEALIDALVKKGFKAIRIPVTWHNHLVDKTYTIDKKWMWRVKAIVDWCIYKGLYVILNTHHDQAKYHDSSIEYAEGYYPLVKDMEESERFLYNVWKQIATAFNNNYDHHLIFEGLNEPRIADLEHEWSYDPDDEKCEEAAEVLNEYNRLILSAIRSTAGNNAYRFVMVTPLAASYDYAVYSNFVIPDDTLYNPDTSLRRILISVHLYSPYNFAMDAYSGVTTCDSGCKSELDSYFYNLYQKFVLKGYRVIITEMGSINKNNVSARVAWGKYFVQGARKRGLGSIVWDNQYWGSGSQGETFGLLHRDSLSWEPDEYVKALISAAKTTLAW